MFRYVEINQKLVSVFTGIALLCSWSDALSQQFNADTPARITSETARHLAAQEVSRRGLPLPKDWQAQVRDLFADYDGRPSQPIFAVTIFNTVNGNRKNLYAVSINKGTGKVEDFLDMRSEGPIDNH
jgi:hypothetical protein